LKNVPNNNGTAGIYGISYPGFYVAAGMADSHPALKACSPQAPVTDLYMGDDAYHNGAFMLEANFSFYTFFKPRAGLEYPPKEWDNFDYGTNDGYDFYLAMGPLSNAKKLYLKDTNFYWDDQVRHPTYDEFWKSRNISTHMKNINCAVMTVGGLFDAEDLQGPYRIFSFGCGDESRHAESHRRRPVGARGLGVYQGRSSRAGKFCWRPFRVL